MALLRSQKVFTDGGPQALELVASNGNIFTLTKAQVQTFYQSTSGNAASRRQQVIDWIKGNIVSTLGGGTIGADEIDIDFDIATGGISRSQIGRPIPGVL